MLPKGEDVNEWLAVNTVDFFNEISLLYGTITEFCLPTTCPVMCAGPHYQYLWADTTGKYKQPVKVSAPEYVDLLMSWVEAQLNDETLFPLQLGTPFPKNFQSVVKNIFKRLFRVYAHIYHSHFQKIVGLGAEAHLNTCFKHVSIGIYTHTIIHARTGTVRSCSSAQVVQSVSRMHPLLLVLTLSAVIHVCVWMCVYVCWFSSSTL